MTHLTDIEIGEAAERGEALEAQGHLATCEACTRRVEDVRSALHEVATVAAFEPSPLFWEHFPARVSRAIDAPQSRDRRWLPARAMAWFGAAAMVTIGAIGVYSTRSAVGPDAVPVIGLETKAVLPSSEGDVGGVGESWPDPIEVDEAWAVMQSLAVDLHYDDASTAGLVPRAGSVESVATELSERERIELVRLIRHELKRMGV